MYFNISMHYIEQVTKTRVDVDAMFSDWLEDRNIDVHEPDRVYLYSPPDGSTARYEAYHLHHIYLYLSLEPFLLFFYSPFNEKALFHVILCLVKYIISMLNWVHSRHSWVPRSFGERKSLDLDLVSDKPFVRG